MTIFSHKAGSYERNSVQSRPLGGIGPPFSFSAGRLGWVGRYLGLFVWAQKWAPGGLFFIFGIDGFEISLLRPLSE
jgi:hypothetical protein